jgi:hypothetical protein
MFLLKKPAGFTLLTGQVRLTQPEVTIIKFTGTIS